MVSVYFTSDLHGRMSFRGYLKNITDRENSLILDGGDAINGNNYFGPSREKILDEMENSGYFAMAMGNREFCYNRILLKKRIKQTSIKILSANLVDIKKRDEDYLIPFAVKNIGKSKIGIIGLTANQFSHNIIFSKITGFDFIDYKKASDKYINLIKEKVDIIIVLSHSGFNEDMYLLENSNAPIVILGGHSHKITPEPLIRNNSIMFHAGAYANKILKVILDDSSGKLSYFGYEFINLI
jgi:2',3'-cyclic-nucleotide 2'-phosphodiesterase (5'-nucleotidase family)